MKDLLFFIKSDIYAKGFMVNLEKVWYMISLCILGVVAISYRALELPFILGWLLITCLVEVLLTGHLWVDARDGLLLVGFLSYFLLAKHEAPFSWTFLMLLAYQYAKLFILSDRRLYKKRIYQILLTLVLSMGTYALLTFLNIVEYIVSEWWFPFQKEATIQLIVSAWGEGRIYYTSFTAHLLFSVSLLFWSAASFRKHVAISIFIIFTTAVGLMCTLYTGLRTPTLLTLITTAVAAIIYFLKNRKDKKTQSYYKKAMVLGLILVILAIILFFLNVNGIRDYIMSSKVQEMMNRTGGIVHNRRFKWQLYVLTHIFEYPFGGQTFEDCYGQAHNMWLDVAKASGIIPFAALVAMTVLSIKDCIRVIKCCDKLDMWCVFTPGVFIGYTVFNMVEPTIESIPLLLVFYYMISGALRADAFYGMKERRLAKRRSKKRR